MGSKHVGDSVFRKMRLVDDSELQHLIEKRLREYDPTLSKRADLQIEMSGLLDRNDITAEEKLALYKATQTNYDSLTRDRPDPATQGQNIDLPRVPVGPEGLPPLPPPGNPLSVPETRTLADVRALLKKVHPVAAHPSRDASGSSASPSDETVSNVLNAEDSATGDKGVKKHTGSERNAEKQTRLFTLLKQNPQFVTEDPQTGELILEGQRIPNSSYRNLFSSLYQTQSTHNLTGWTQFLTTLAKLFNKSSIRTQNLTNYISAKSAIDQLNPQTGKGRKRGHISKTTPPGRRLKVLKLYR